MSWAVTTATIILKNPLEIKKLAGYVWGKVFRRKQLAITGMAGVGKTVLLHALTGESRQPDYRKPSQSHKVETRKVKTAAGRILLSCVPGQPATPRYAGLDDLFLGLEPVYGVIHVVANGLASLRTRAAADVLVEQGITTPGRYRTHQKKAELQDLKETCEKIVQSHHRHRAPTWMLVAVDKIDLYPREIEDAERYYTNDSPFTAELEKVKRRVGSEFFRWDALPISGCGEDFIWNGKTLTSRLSDDERNHHLFRFLQELSSR